MYCDHFDSGSGIYDLWFGSWQKFILSSRQFDLLGIADYCRCRVIDLEKMGCQLRCDIFFQAIIRHVRLKQDINVYHVIFNAVMNFIFALIRDTSQSLESIHLMIAGWKYCSAFEAH